MMLLDETLVPPLLSVSCVANDGTLPMLIDQVVDEVMSRGLFDSFRRECLEDADTRPAYQNLHARVGQFVRVFLAQQKWTPDSNRNQLRDRMGRQLMVSQFMNFGVDRIVDQVVDRNVCIVYAARIHNLVTDVLLRSASQYDQCDTAAGENAVAGSGANGDESEEDCQLQVVSDVESELEESDGGHLMVEVAGDEHLQVDVAGEGQIQVEVAGEGQIQVDVAGDVEADTDGQFGSWRQQFHTESFSSSVANVAEDDMDGESSGSLSPCVLSQMSPLSDEGGPVLLEDAHVSVEQMQAEWTGSTLLAESTTAGAANPRSSSQLNQVYPSCSPRIDLNTAGATEDNGTGKHCQLVKPKYSRTLPITADASEGVKSSPGTSDGLILVSKDISHNSATKGSHSTSPLLSKHSTHESSSSSRVSSDRVKSTSDKRKSRHKYGDEKNVLESASTGEKSSGSMRRRTGSTKHRSSSSTRRDKSRGSSSRRHTHTSSSSRHDRVPAVHSDASSASRLDRVPAVHSDASSASRHDRVPAVHSDASSASRLDRVPAVHSDAASLEPVITVGPAGDGTQSSSQRLQPVVLLHRYHTDGGTGVVVPTSPGAGGDQTVLTPAGPIASSPPQRRQSSNHGWSEAAASPDSSNRATTSSQDRMATLIAKYAPYRQNSISASSGSHKRRRVGRPSSVKCQMIEYLGERDAPQPLERQPAWQRARSALLVDDDRLSISSVDTDCLSDYDEMLQLDVRLESQQERRALLRMGWTIAPLPDVDDQSPSVDIDDQSPSVDIVGLSQPADGMRSERFDGEDGGGDVRRCRRRRPPVDYQALHSGHA